jgi:hypothetical protein
VSYRDQTLFSQQNFSGNFRKEAGKFKFENFPVSPSAAGLIFFSNSVVEFIRLTLAHARFAVLDLTRLQGTHSYLWLIYEL